MTRRPIALLAVGLLVAAAPHGTPTAVAEPVPAAERGPVDIRRTTLVVRDVDASLKLYRDALGLKVIYDQVIGNERKVRLVLLRANDTFVGNLGLMQRLNPSVEPSPVKRERAQPGDPILVINVADLEQRLPLAKAVPGVVVDSDTSLIEYPGPDGKTKIPVNVTTLWDPDGFFIELNQILGRPAGT